MSEFVVLVEYTEVVVPFIFTGYVIAVFHLSNRAYYAQIAHLDTQQLAHLITNVMVYCGFEVLSFLVINAILRRRFGVATFKQLAFVLEKQAAAVQSNLMLWLLYAVQTSLDHMGADYSFKLAWLGKQSSS